MEYVIRHKQPYALYRVKMTREELAHSNEARNALATQIAELRTRLRSMEAQELHFRLHEMSSADGILLPIQCRSCATLSDQIPADCGNCGAPID